MLGAPLPADKGRYIETRIDDIRIFYPVNLKIKEGFDAIHIRAKKFAFWTWLELEGAKAIPVFSH